MRLAIILACAGLSVLDVALAASPVNVQHQCDDDPVGIQLAYHMRQEIEKSATLKLVETAPVTYSIICISPQDEDKGIVTHFAYTIDANTSLPYDLLLGSGVATLGRNRVATSAIQRVASLDDTVRELTLKIESGELDALFKD